jgi:hypothetical protein
MVFVRSNSANNQESNPGLLVRVRVKKKRMLLIGFQSEVGCMIWNDTEWIEMKQWLICLLYEDKVSVQEVPEGGISISPCFLGPFGRSQ